MTAIFSYTVYGLTVHSDFPLPELVPPRGENGNEAAAGPEETIRIRLGATPKDLRDPTGRGVLYQASANQCLVKLDVAHYLVQNGNEIIVQPAPGAQERDVRVFLRGSCFGALMHQRETLVLHASAIRTEAGAVLFAGPSGIGKSTLLGEMMNRGHPMMVDDVCAVSLDEDGTPVVLPGFPRTCLWADAARKLGVDTKGLPRTRANLEKYERQLPEQFWDQPAPLRHIYTLGTTNSEELTLHALPRIRTFSAVLFNTYRRAFLDGMEMRQSHFAVASAVSACVGVTRAVRPSGAFKLAALADLILSDLA